MKLLFLIVLSLQTIHANADPEQDRLNFANEYFKKFPQLQLQDFADGVYAIDPIARESWQAIEEFPPYEFALDNGKDLFETPFDDGSTYSDCFQNEGIGVASIYPRWDKQQKQVVTLAQAINDCRVKNGEQPLSYGKGKLADLLAYLAYISREYPIQINIPPSDPGALDAYQKGKEYYYRRRGQLNFACSTCHIQNAGKLLRSELLSPALGHTSHWPAYRLKWGELGTLHRRFIGCHEQIRAPLPKAQSKELKNLEYFMSYMNNGIKINGPGTRK